MADEKPSGSWSSGLVVAAFATVSALYVSYQRPPLVSSRPSEAVYAVHELKAKQDLDARLWQDPFDAVMRDLADKQRGSPQHDEAGFDHPGEKTLLLGVTLPGASYPEVAETRRRLRYAVLSALHVAGYAPADEKHIGYWRPGGAPTKTSAPVIEVRTFQNDRPAAIAAAPPGAGVEINLGIGIALRAAEADGQRPAEATPDAPPLPEIVPWEEFDDISNDHVLVLWLDEDVLSSGRRPIAGLVELRTQLIGLHNGKRFTAEDKFMLLGPSDSTMLQAMVHEKRWTNDTKLIVYNFGATAEDKLVTGGGSVEDGLRQVGLEYHRVVNTDDELAHALACDLMRRDANLYLLGVDDRKTCGGPDRKGPRNDVVVLSDWDTVYGRDLTDAVAKTFAPAGADSSRIIRQSYLRGLDGRLPGRKYPSSATTAPNDSGEHKAAEPAAASLQSAATPETAGRFESAEGQSQYDYLRRLAADLKKEDDELRRKQGARIGAIGVLGSDVYDKLLILQALRPEFPDTIFFTTDLDALLLPQKESHNTRNLLVASAYGLKPTDPEWQVLRFRSTYQTAIFKATRAAIADGAGKPSLLPLTGKPLLLQIGRTAAQPLSLSDGTPARLYPHLPTKIGFAVFFLSLVGVFIPLLVPAVRKVCFYKAYQTEAAISPDAILRQKTAWALALALALACGEAVLLGWSPLATRLTEFGQGEPMSLFEGISVWPTIALRALGSVLSLFLIVYTLCALEKNRYETAVETGVADQPPPFRAARTLIRDALKTGSRGTWFWYLLWLPPADRYNSEGYDPCRPGVWFRRISAYGYSAKWQIRCARAFCYTMIMMAAWQLVLAPIFGDLNAPARGELAQRWYFVVTLVNVFLALFLIFLVVDALIYNTAFIKRLAKVFTVWPEATLSRFGRTFALKGDALADWLDMQYLANRTRCLTNLVYLPFIALALLTLSRSPLFDNFSTPLTLPVAQGICVAAIIGSVVAYRWAAEEARDEALRHLTAKIVTASGNDPDGPCVAQLKLMANEIGSLKAGAFAPWASQPIVKAVLLPLITYGGTWLLHLYALPGT